jgi:hypothetical protein
MHCTPFTLPATCRAKNASDQSTVTTRMLRWVTRFVVRRDAHFLGTGTIRSAIQDEAPVVPTLGQMGCGTSTATTRASRPWQRTSLKQTHGRFASYWNGVNRSSGHVWQGRYYSCPLDDTHLWEALRYTELNPVRAFLVTSAKDWALVFCGCALRYGPMGPWLTFAAWERRW